MHWKARLPVFAAALWWGSLTVIGFIAVPLLFAHAPSKALAGALGAKLFQAESWVAIGCGVVLLASARDPQGTPALGWAGGAVGYVLLGLLCAMVQEFAVAPRIMARQELAFWHSAGTALYSVQWLCALVVLWKVTTDESRHPRAGGDPESARSTPSGALEPRLGGDDGSGSPPPRG